MLLKNFSIDRKMEKDKKNGERKTEISRAASKSQD